MRPRRVFLTILFSLTASACATAETDVLTYEEFVEATYLDPDRGIRILDGDEPAATEDELRQAYDRYAATFEEDDGVGRAQLPATVNVVGGQWDRWPNGSTLTYCIPSKGFTAARKTALKNAIAAAGAEWSAAGNIHFTYLSSQDGNCTNRNNNVTFNVKSVCRGQYLASAFFPSYARRSRELSIDCTAFGDITPWTLTGVLRHELGHTIGLRHEHVRAPGNPCPEGGSYAGLTAYDSESVMHYPQCEGSQDGDLVLTADDRAGAALLYP